MRYTSTQNMFLEKRLPSVKLSTINLTAIMLNSPTPISNCQTVAPKYILSKADTMIHDRRRLPSHDAFS